MTAYPDTFQLKNGQQRPTCGLVSSGNVRESGVFRNGAAGAAVSKTLSSESSSSGVNPKPPTGRKTGPERIGAIIPEVLRDIENRMKRNRGQK